MTYEEWLNEVEHWGIRWERAVSDLSNNPDAETIDKWLKAAYNVGLHEGYEKGMNKGELIC